MFGEIFRFIEEIKKRFEAERLHAANSLKWNKQ